MKVCVLVNVAFGADGRFIEATGKDPKIFSSTTALVVGF